MSQSSQLIFTSITQALQELRVNKLRTFLSLLGITIGIFCIIAVLTVLDSMKNNIQDQVASLGSDVLYINRKPWIPEGGEYKWWEYLQRPPMTEVQLDAINKNPGVKYSTMCYVTGVTAKYHDQEVTGGISYGVTPNFDQIQNIEVVNGRYLTAAEIEGGSYAVVIGDELYNSLFPSKGDPLNKSITFSGRKFAVIGVLKKQGRNMAGFNFDRALIYPFKVAKALHNTSSLDWENDPLIMVKASPTMNINDLKDEVEGILRTTRKVRPNEKNNFAINQLSQVSERLDVMFGTINMIGVVIGGFSLIVGAFGIANIMFVTVKERTKIIGLKKAIGAKRRSILMEFLIEAITLCLAGGLVGIIIVLLLSLLFTYGFNFEITLSIKNFLVGISISAVVGILAGFIPARAASRLDPVVAIRSN